MAVMYSKNGIIIKKIKYNEGDAIDLTNNTISVKYGKGLTVNPSNELEVNTNIFEAGNCIDVVKNGNNVTFSFDVTAGITDIKVVNTIPETPSSTVLYLIPEES